MSSPTPETIARNRAAALLDVPATSSSADARAAFLRRLERVNFRPSEDWQVGLALLDDRARASRLAPMATARVKRESLRAEVDAFAAGFWQMKSLERLVRWKGLIERCKDEPLLFTILQCLSVGMDIEPEEFDKQPGNLGVIARLIRDLFILRPAEMAMRRRDWLISTAHSADAWKNIAARLRQQAPTIAALDPTLMQAIVDRAKRESSRSPARPIAISRSVSVPQTGDNKTPWWSIVVGFWIVFAVFRSLVGSSSSSSISYPSDPPRNYHYIPPKYSPQNQDLNRLLDEARKLKQSALKPEPDRVLEEAQKLKLYDLKNDPSRGLVLPRVPKITQSPSDFGPSTKADPFTTPPKGSPFGSGANK